MQIFWAQWQWHLGCYIKFTACQGAHLSFSAPFAQTNQDIQIYTCCKHLFYMFVFWSSLPEDLKLMTGVMMQRTGESECYSTSIPGSLSFTERAGDWGLVLFNRFKAAKGMLCIVILQNRNLGKWNNSENALMWFVYNLFQRFGPLREPTRIFLFYTCNLYPSGAWGWRISLFL